MGRQPFDKTGQAGEDCFQDGVACNLAADVAQDPAKIGAQAFEFAAHAPELPRMGIAAGADRRRFCRPRVALPERDAVLPGLTDQHLQRLQIQLAVSRMGDRFGLHCCINIDPFQGLRPGCPRFQRRLDARLQQFLQPLRSDPLAPARHCARIDRCLVLKELEAAEELPVGIFYPALDHFLVGQVVHMLQIMQPDHQPGRLGGPTKRPIEPAEHIIKSFPWDHAGQSHQNMASIDDRIQTFPKQVSLAAGSTGWAHDKNTRNQRHQRRFPAFSNTSKPMGIPYLQGLLKFFSADYRR